MLTLPLWTVPLALVGLLQATPPLLTAPVESKGISGESFDGPALALEREVLRLTTSTAAAGALWPGFDPLTIPLAIFDGERTFLFRHPAAPDGFAPIESSEPSGRVWQGRHPAMTANSSADIGGVGTATVLLVGSALDRDLTSTAAMALHEAFHVYARAHQPLWTANEADLFAYPTDSAPQLALRRLETTALLRALAAPTQTQMAGWARRALELRRERFAGMDATFWAFERGSELNEGLATYVELRAAARPGPDLPALDYPADQVRQRAYQTGAAFGFLLDRCAPKWREQLSASEQPALDVALQAALGEGEAFAFKAQEEQDAHKKAQADVLELRARLALRLAEFERQSKDPGAWTVVVEMGGEPLWPSGFDPLNVERLTASQILHGRFLKLGNGQGELEVLDARALTDGIGSHPLFQGVRRVTILLASKPEHDTTQGLLRVRAPGLSLQFQTSSVLVEGQTLRLQLAK